MDDARIYCRPAPLEIKLECTTALLHVSPSFIIHTAHPPPNRWWRFWQWALLGWKWERI